MFRKRQGKQASEITVGRSVSGLGIKSEAHHELLAELHVHHVLRVAHIRTGKFAHLSGLVVKFDVLYSISGQIVEHQTSVVAHEIAAVEQQRFHLAAVDKYFAVVVQLHAWKLADKRVEHAPFGQIESVGVVYKRVATVIELYLGRRHGHFAEAARELTLEIHRLKVFRVDRLAQRRRVDIEVLSSIFRSGNLKHVFHRLLGGRNLDIEFRRIPLLLAVADIAACLLGQHLRAVGRRKQTQPGPDYIGAHERFAHSAPHYYAIGGPSLDSSQDYTDCNTNFL